METWTTRANHLVDPSLHVWSWQIPLYLFLGGLVAGMMVLAGASCWRGRPMRGGVAQRFPLLALLAITLGMIALFLDLEHKLYVLRLYLTIEPASPMSWGAWILLLVYPILFALLALTPPAGLAARAPWIARIGHWIAQEPVRLRGLGALAIAVGIGLGLYTGVLLSSLGARPFWSNGLLAPLFLVSGLSSGAALGHLLSELPEERKQLIKVDSLLLLAELALLVLFVISLASAGTASRTAAGLLLGGPLTAVFWVLVFAIGIAFPLTIQSLSIAGRIGHAPLAPVLVLLGGLALRVLVVLAGQLSHWKPV
ncbi:MAG: NrfD/PsrC family molybdoenzyme membrane anchor subunit [Candidatus Eisenbacteria bacterium]